MDVVLYEIKYNNNIIISSTTQCPVFRAAQSVLRFTPWQTSSIEHNVDLSGSIQLLCKQCAKIIRTQISATVFRQVLIHITERTEAL